MEHNALALSAQKLTSTPEPYGESRGTVTSLGEKFSRVQVTLSDPSPVGSEVINRNFSPAMSRKSSVVSWSGRPCEQLEASSTPSGQSAPFDDAGNGTTGCTESVLKSVVGHGFAAGLEPDACGSSRNGLPRERSEPRFPAVGGTSESALMSSGSLRNTSNTPKSSGVSHGTVTRESVTSSFSAEVTVPSTCLVSCMEQLQIHRLRNASPLLHSLYLLSPLESSWCQEIRTATERNGTVRRAGANPRRSREFNVKRYVNLWHNLKSVMKLQRQKLRSQAPRTDEKFLVSYTSAIGLLCYTATRTCFSVHNAVLSTLVDH